MTDLVWHSDAYSVAGLVCPSCGATGPHRHLLTAPGGGVEDSDWQVLDCASCGCRFSPDRRIADYGAEGASADGAVIEFYLEQGAGVDVMLEPLGWLRPGGAGRLLEIGGGAGFASDYAEQALGWQTRGFDPSPLAATGRDRLGLDVTLDYFADDTPIDRPFDVVYASEVVEHVPDPVAFLRSAMRALAPDGVLVLTTPDAAAIAPGTTPDLLRAIVSPGHHLSLFSRDALMRVLAQAGFTHMDVSQSATALVGFASRSPLPARLSAQRLDRALYRGYLQRRFGGWREVDRLASGYGYRLFKEQVNSGLYAEALAAFHRLAAASLATYGLAVADAAVPQPPVASLEALGRQQPYNLAGLYYFRAVIAANHQGDFPLAERFAVAAIAAATRLRQVLQLEGTGDGETWDLENSARLMLPMVMTARDPQAARDRFIELVERAPAYGIAVPALAAARGMLARSLLSRLELRAAAQVLRLRLPRAEAAPEPVRDADLAMTLARDAFIHRQWDCVVDAVAGEQPPSEWDAALRLQYWIAKARVLPPGEAIPALLEIRRLWPATEPPEQEEREMALLFTDWLAPGHQTLAELAEPLALSYAARPSVNPMEAGSVLLAAGLLGQIQGASTEHTSGLYARAEHMFALAMQLGTSEATALRDECRRRLVQITQEAREKAGR